MSKQEIIEQTMQLLEQLPEEKAAEILDFAAFLMQRSEATSSPISGPLHETTGELRSDLAAIMAHSKAFDFLHDEPDLYSDADIVERY